MSDQNCLYFNDCTSCESKHSCTGCDSSQAFCDQGKQVYSTYCNNDFKWNGACVKAGEAIMSLANFNSIATYINAARKVGTKSNNTGAGTVGTYSDKQVTAAKYNYYAGILGHGTVTAGVTPIKGSYFDGNSGLAYSANKLKLTTTQCDKCNTKCDECDKCEGCDNCQNTETCGTSQNACCDTSAVQPCTLSER